MEEIITETKSILTRNNLTLLITKRIFSQAAYIVDGQTSDVVPDGAERYVTSQLFVVIDPVRSDDCCGQLIHCPNESVIIRARVS